MSVVPSTELFKLPYNDLTSRFPLIGEGDSRYIFDLTDGTVLKRAKITESGVFQTQMETAIFNQATEDGNASLFCPILYCDESNIIMPKAETSNLSGDFSILLVDIINVIDRDMINSTISSISKEYPDTSIPLKPKSDIVLSESRVEQVRNSLLYSKVHMLYDTYGITLDELERVEHWGIYEGDFVLLDYGMSENVGLLW